MVTTIETMMEMVTMHDGNGDVATMTVVVMTAAMAFTKVMATVKASAMATLY